MPVNECNAQSGQWLTPAGRRAASCGQNVLIGNPGSRRRRSKMASTASTVSVPAAIPGLPRQPENAPALVRMTTQYRPIRGDHLRIVCRRSVSVRPNGSAAARPRTTQSALGREGAVDPPLEGARRRSPRTLRKDPGLQLTLMRNCTDGPNACTSRFASWRISSRPSGRP